MIFLSQSVLKVDLFPERKSNAYHREVVFIFGTVPPLRFLLVVVLTDTAEHGAVVQQETAALTNSEFK